MFQFFFNFSNFRSMFQIKDACFPILHDMFAIFEDMFQFYFKFSNFGSMFQIKVAHFPIFHDMFAIFEDIFLFLKTYSRWSRTYHAKFCSYMFSGGHNRFVFCLVSVFEGSDAIFGGM